jgi:hypothetical protein
MVGRDKSLEESALGGGLGRVRLLGEHWLHDATKSEERQCRYAGRCATEQRTGNGNMHIPRRQFRHLLRHESFLLPTLLVESISYDCGINVAAVADEGC